MQREVAGSDGVGILMSQLRAAATPLAPTRAAASIAGVAPDAGKVRTNIKQQHEEEAPTGGSGVDAIEDCEVLRACIELLSVILSPQDNTVRLSSSCICLSILPFSCASLSYVLIA